MARIRTIKPEFFTSEDIVSLSPMARLLYISTWCEADKEGRLVWKPVTFKLRYFPGDKCDIQALCQELVSAGLVVLYGEGLAFIPKFNAHQHLNPRETPSKLPEPDASARVATRQHASNLDVHAQGGREGKGREGYTRVDACDDAPGFAKFWQTWPSTERKQAKGKCLDAWKKADGEKVADEIISHVESLKNSQTWTKNNGEYIPAPLVYLNNRRWEGADLVDQGFTIGKFV